MNLSRGEKIFSTFNYVSLALLAMASLYPFIYVLSASFSNPTSVILGDVVFFPKNVTLDAYRTVFEKDGIWLAYGNTVYYTVVGTAVSLILTTLGAYPLSKRRLIGASSISFFIAFTMWFHAGMIPMFLNLRDLGLLNQRSAIIFAFAISTFNVFIMRTFFQNVPYELEESAKIDGASDVRILWSIYLPLSKAAFYTLGLLYAVSRWNSYFWAMILLKDEKKIPLQVLLKKLIVEMEVDPQSAVDTNFVLSQQTVIYATIIISIIPMLVVYPFIQKHFVKGVMIGSIKG